MRAQELFNLRGRVALVTGAGGRLGSAMAQALAEAGATVVLGGRNPASLQGTEETIRAHKGTSQIAVFDVTDERGCTRAIREIAGTLGRLDILVNNACVQRTGTLDQSSGDDFASSYAITVSAAFRLVQLALPLLESAAARTAGGASVINIATMYGLVSPDPRIYGASGLNSPPYYGAAKAGLLQLTRYLACHLAPRRIRVNSVTPGAFPSEKALAADPQFKSALCAKVPLGRVGSPGEIGGPVLFLASDAAAYVTGANLVVDGGWTAW